MTDHLRPRAAPARAALAIVPRRSPPDRVILGRPRRTSPGTPGAAAADATCGRPALRVARSGDERHRGDADPRASLHEMVHAGPTLIPRVQLMVPVQYAERLDPDRPVYVWRMIQPTDATARSWRGRRRRVSAGRRQLELTGAFSRPWPVAGLTVRHPALPARMRRTNDPRPTGPRRLARFADLLTVDGVDVDLGVSPSRCWRSSRTFRRRSSTGSLSPQNQGGPADSVRGLAGDHHRIGHRFRSVRDLLTVPVSVIGTSGVSAASGAPAFSGCLGTLRAPSRLPAPQKLPGTRSRAPSRLAVGRWLAAARWLGCWPMVPPLADGSRCWLTDRCWPTATAMPRARDRQGKDRQPRHETGARAAGSHAITMVREPANDLAASTEAARGGVMRTSAPPGVFRSWPRPSSF